MIHGSDCRLILKFWDGRTDSLCENSDHYCGRPRESIKWNCLFYSVIILFVVRFHLLEKFSYLTHKARPAEVVISFARSFSKVYMAVLFAQKQITSVPQSLVGGSLRFS